MEPPGREQEPSSRDHGFHNHERRLAAEVDHLCIDGSMHRNTRSSQLLVSGCYFDRQLFICIPFAVLTGPMEGANELRLGLGDERRSDLPKQRYALPYCSQTATTIQLQADTNEAWQLALASMDTRQLRSISAGACNANWSESRGSCSALSPDDFGFRRRSVFRFRFSRASRRTTSGIAAVEAHCRVERQFVDVSTPPVSCARAT